MSHQSDGEEDRAFASLSESERKVYFLHLKDSGGNVRGSLDATLGPVWFNRDESPRGHRYSGKNDDEK